MGIAFCSIVTVLGRQSTDQTALTYDLLGEAKLG